MKTTIDKIEVVTPASKIKPDENRKRNVLIATEQGDLMMNRLRRLLEKQEQTQHLDEKDRLTVKVPDTLFLEVVTSYVRKSKAMRRMDKALDRKADEYADLCEATSMLAGQLDDLLSAAREFLTAFVTKRGDVTIETFSSLAQAITDADTLIDEIYDRNDE